MAAFHYFLNPGIFSIIIANCLNFVSLICFLESVFSLQKLACVIFLCNVAAGCKPPLQVCSLATADKSLKVFMNLP